MKENLEVKMQEKPLKITLAILRFIMAVEFLWAFLDKLLGLGFATKPEGAWIRGGSPTFGFLAKGSTGPFAGIFQAIGGKGITDWLFMLALLLIGVALALGIGMKIATISGSVLMFFMWAASLPKPNNLFPDRRPYNKHSCFTCSSVCKGRTVCRTRKDLGQNRPC